MCFAVNQVNKKAIEHLLKPFTDAEIPQTWVPRRWVDAFTFPLLPVLMEGGKVELARWGLIPSWAKDDRVLELRTMTLNAKSETMFSLPSFRNSASSLRCLIPVNGFFEYQHLNNAGVPDPAGRKSRAFLLRLKDHEAFFLGGLWSQRNGEKTFTICTMPANSLMKEIHNAKERQPVVILEEWARDWVKPGLPQVLEKFLTPRDDLGLVAEPTEGKPKPGEMELF